MIPSDWRISLFFAIPFLAIISSLVFRNKQANYWFLCLSGAFLCFLAFFLGGKEAMYTEYFSIDALSGLFLVVLTTLFFLISLAIPRFLQEGKWSKREETIFIISILSFVAAMAGAILSNHMGLMWVFIELTTIASAYLIYFNKTKHSLEATWKYVFICSIGISLAFVGIILLSVSVGNLNSLFLRDLYANATMFSPYWLKISFVFLVVGFGTKMGLAPVHAWLPDAHAEAPSPISALLSGTLLNTALLAILRVNKLMNLANLGEYAKWLLMIMGFLSVLISAAYILQVRNYKRMLAYSSIENMGIISIAVALGKPGYYAALIHVVAHSFAKSSFFLTAGNILSLYKSKNIGEIRGLLQHSPLVAALLILSFAAIVGIPPFPAFWSEFFLLKEMLNTGNYWQAIVLSLLLTFVLYGIGHVVFHMCLNSPNKQVSVSKLEWHHTLPQIIILLLLIVISVALPFGFVKFIDAARAVL